MSRANPTAPMRDRVHAALRREGESDANTIARGLGQLGSAVHNVLLRGIEQGWCRHVRRDGRNNVYAFVAGEERAQ